MPTDSLVMISLPADPTAPLHAASKQYVDSALSTIAINDLTDVNTTTVAPTVGQALLWDGISQWVPTTLPAGGISIFANAAARDAAIPVPTEGMYCHLLDTDTLQTRGATAWVDVISIDETDSIEIGDATATGSSTVAIGKGAVASSPYANTVGAYCTASGGSAFAAGSSCTATATNTVSIGTWAKAAGASSTAIGDQAETSAAATHSTAIGFHAEATTPNTVVLGDKDASLRIPTGTAPPTAVAALAGNLYAVDTGAAGELWLKTSNTGTATTPSFAGWTKIPTSTGAESLDALSDVDTTTVAPLDKTGLVWNATNAEWEPGTSVTVSTAPPTPGPGNAPTIDGLLWVVVT